MAYWGIAMTQLNNPFSPPPAQNLVDGWAALEQARQLGAKSERETGYITALAEFYRDADTKDHRARVLAYEAAMAQLHARYPDDREAAIHYALALNVAALPTDKTYAKQLQAAEILEAEVVRQPDHPGVVHYLIHTYDYPPLAERGLEAADRYAELAASAPHALHMPSHIFTRVGHWDRSIETNRRAAEVARGAKDVNGELHARDYMVYAYLQRGHDEAARQAIAEAQQFAGAESAGPAGPFALAAMPARFAMERGAWEEAAALTPQPSKFAFADAVTHFARAMGLARSGKPEAAAADVEALQRLADALRASNAYWAEQVDIQHTAATAWIAYAEGRQDEALALIRKAVETEAGTEKHAITPGPLAPAREQLAEMLLAADRPTRRAEGVRGGAAGRAQPAACARRRRPGGGAGGRPGRGEAIPRPGGRAHGFGRHAAARDRGREGIRRGELTRGGPGTLTTPPASDRADQRATPIGRGATLYTGRTRLIRWAGKTGRVTCSRRSICHLATNLIRTRSAGTERS